MSETVIYISKRCPHCRNLLMKIQQREDIKGTIRISSIDDEPFPNAIKNVPLSSEGVIYEGTVKYLECWKKVIRGEGVLIGDKRNHKDKLRILMICMVIVKIDLVWHFL